MTIFDNLINIDEYGEITYNQWLEWYHFLIPNQPIWLRDKLRNALFLFRHCKKCTALSGCYFIERIMPKYPSHPNCDCKKLKLDFAKVKKNINAQCDIKKFTEYIFAEKHKNNGKFKIFHDDLGYTIEDSYFLQQEYCRQASKLYLNGKYTLQNLDNRGQRITIIISLKDKKIKTGWMVHPNGRIQNITPFSGEVTI